MEVIKNDNKQPLTLAQVEFCNQLEQSDRSGQALWAPRVDGDQPAPDCLVSIEEICRFAVMLPEVRYSGDGDDWSCHDADGNAISESALIEQAWEAAKAVRMTLKEALGIRTYVIPVIIFNDMAPDAGILAAAQGRAVKVLFGDGDGDLVRTLVNLPDEPQLQTHLSMGFIQKEMKVLGRDHAREAKPSEANSLELAGGKLVIQHVDVVNIYIYAASYDSRVTLSDG